MKQDSNPVFPDEQPNTFGVVLGFMRDNDLFYYPVVGSVTGDEVVRVFDDFAEKMQDQKYSANDRYTLVVVFKKLKLYNWLRA